MSYEWPRAYGRALQPEPGAGGGLRDEEADLVLILARIVAHGRERRFAPLAAYLAGKFVLQQTAAGVAPERALKEAIAAAEAVLAEPEEPVGDDRPPVP